MNANLVRFVIANNRRKKIYELKQNKKVKKKKQIVKVGIQRLHHVSMFIIRYYYMTLLYVQYINKCTTLYHTI